VIVVGGLLALGVANRQPAFAVLALPAMRVPAWIGARASRARKREADREIPQLLDLLAAASTGGLAAPLAVRRCVEPLRGPLADEIRVSLRAVDLGGRWSEELAALAVRLDLPDLKRTVALLSRTETLGSPLAESVSDLAAQVRSERRARRTERARAAPVKMLFPLVFLVLPAFLLLTVVPVFLTTLRSI
jgi:tight adherence protein C